MRQVLAYLFLFMYVCASAQAQEHMRLTNLPHVYIQTFTGRSITSKDNYVLARMWMVDEHDSVAFYDSLQIRGRGNSTWNMQKKPYKLKFHEKQKLLGKGRPNTKKWTLLANHGDKTLMRNAVTSLLGERMGLPFNPAAKFVDLTLNGTYVGNYQISDHVDVRPHRVDVAEQDVPLTAESNITGGYLLEADGFYDFQNGRTGFYTPHGAPIRIHYPDGDDIASSQYRYIRDVVQDFENRLFGSNFTHPTEGYRARVDSTTLANWYIATEVSGNPDGFFSTYFYKERDDDRLYWGPLWDYDIAYGNDNRLGDTSHRLMKDVGFGAAIARPWVVRMWEDPWFARLVNRRYDQVVGEGLEDYMLHKIDSLAQLLQRSQQLNFQRWGINQRALRECVLYSTYDQYVSDLRKYVSRHIPYLAETFATFLPNEPIVPEPPQYKEPDFAPDTTMYYTVANAGTGTVLDLTAATDNLCANRHDPASQSQQWHIRPLANGYMFITNRMTGEALNDPTPGTPTATTDVGTTLNLATPDSLDTRQQWDIVAQAGDRWNLINRFSQHGANLSGGGSANGTRVISYTSDSRNAESMNRLWTLQTAEPVADGIEQKTATDRWLNGQPDYALAYDPASDRLHFGAEDTSALPFTIRLYDRSGRLLRTFRASESCSMAGLPRGLYIVAWKEGNQQRSVKFMK